MSKKKREKSIRQRSPVPAKVAAPLADGYAEEILGALERAGAPLTQAELKQCNDLHVEMNRHVERYNEHVRASNALAKKADALQAELAQMRKAIDAGDRSGLEAYNAKVQENNDLVAAQEPHQAAMADIAAEQNRTSERFNASCAGRQYHLSDMSEIKRRKN